MTQRWKAALEPWAQAWWKLSRDLAAYCRECDDEELATLLRQTYQPTSTNCWFAVEEVAPIVRGAVESEQTRRAHLTPAPTPEAALAAAREE